jgi:hypothetical protein
MKLPIRPQARPVGTQGAIRSVTARKRRPRIRAKTAIATSTGGKAFTGNATVVETDATGGTKQVEVSDTVDTTATPRRFLRIRTSLQ